ncbi:MAG TPA: cation diffusion facilitator family transporter [Tepidisphaeraceae bacterium]|jgi:cobalt-zinc-cadmium efflux system protein|nr:cation diffusion facilitator family transporter [Tepidisphaeraceae bacterium]
MAHAHFHGEAVGRRMAISVALMSAFVVGELAAGWVGHSLALLSDAGHNFADVLALLLSSYALRAANWPSHAGRTFGYHRVGILAALANAASLVVIAFFIMWEAVVRLRHPELATPSGKIMIGAAGAAILVNGAVAWSLHGSAKNDLNVRSAYLHMLGDALSAVGVVVAGAIVAVSRNPLADPIVSLLIGAMILWSSWDILEESVGVLLEGTPAGLDMMAVEKAIVSAPGVLDVHDLHVWTVGAGVVACSCHVVVAEQSIREGQQVLRAVAEELAHHFRINHTTVQIEVEGCQANEMYCTVRPHGGHEHAGHEHHH